MLYEESGVTPEIARERGYTTVRGRAELPPEFKRYQRRRGLLVPMHSPDGETTSYQLRPDKPRKGGPKYETPAGISPVVDVHPRMLEEARHGGGSLLITEGAKTGDAAASRGICTVVLAGVWMWCVPKVKPYRLKPCFDNIRLEGREVFVAFDSDCMSKANVQDALAALVAALQARGAVVKVIYLPDASSGAKQGVDDYLVAGGTVREMFMLAREFNPADVGRIRLSRDEKLRAAVEDLERRWWAEEWKGRGGHSDRDIALELIEAAARCGKLHADGLRVKVSWGTLQVGAKVARQTLAKALARLEERGFLYRDNEGRKPDKTGAFVLRAKVDQYGERQAQEEKVTHELRECDPGGLPLRALPDVPRLRWSRPKWKPTKKMIREYRLRELLSLPEPRERIERLGKIRGSVLDALEVAGGELTLHELCEVLHHKRARDVRRRVLPMLVETGVVEVANDVIRLAPEWREELEAERREKGEVSYQYTLEYVNGVGEVCRKEVRMIGADELAEDRRKCKSRAYRERDKAPFSKPSAASLAAVERGRAMCTEERVNEHEERQAKAHAAELEAKRFAKKFVHDRLRALGCIRLDLLQEILRDAGGTPSYVLPAAKSLGCTVERLPEFNDAEFVFAREEAA